MNHSKLPWKEEKFENNYRGIVDADDRTVLVLSWNANKCDEDIAFIAKACNEHDTLKAKAELFDDAIDKLGLVLGFLNHCEKELNHRGETQLHRDWIGDVLSRARGLK